MTGAAGINYNSPVNFYTPQQPPDGIPENLKPAFRQVYNSMQQVILAMINNCGIGPQLTSDWPQLDGLPSTILAANMGRFYARATENILFGQIVSLADDGAGNISCRLANATDGTKPGHGYCSAPNGILLGDVGEVILGHGINSVGGLTVGSNYWLSTTSGLITATPPVAAGNIEQYIGVAIGATSLYVNMSGWVRH